MADYYAHLYHDDPKAADVLEDDDFDPDNVEAELAELERLKQNPDEWDPV